MDSNEIAGLLRALRASGALKAPYEPVPDRGGAISKTRKDKKMTPKNALATIEALTANRSVGARDLVWSLCSCFRSINGALRFCPEGWTPCWITDAEDKKAFLESLKDGLCDGELLDGRTREDVEEAFSAVQKMLRTL